MIYSNKRIIIPGPYGTIKDYQFSQDLITQSEEGETKTDPAVFLGMLDDVCYRYFPDDTDMTEITAAQDEAIEFQQASLTTEQMAAIRAQPYMRMYKTNTRKLIEQNVGDTMDLISDVYKLSEFAIIAVSAMLADKGGLITMSDETLQAYAQRGAAVLQAVNSGKVTLRSDYEDPAEMIASVIPKYSALQDIVRDNYISQMREFGVYPSEESAEAETATDSDAETETTEQAALAAAETVTTSTKTRSKKA